MRLYVDLDGVLADFKGLAQSILGKSDYTKKELWSTLKPYLQTGEFWMSLSKMPDANILWSAIKDKDPIILTATGHIAPDVAAKYKTKWVRKHFGNVPVIAVRNAKDKLAYAVDGSILIDDRYDTIQGWDRAGGIGIFHTSAKQTIKQLPSSLREDVVAKFKKTIKIDIEVEARTTKHADERQAQRRISDNDIATTVYKAIDKIMQAYTDGTIRDGEQFRIYDPANNHLNLIAVFHMNDKGTPEKVRIITAIKKRDFKPNNIKRTIKV